MFEENMNQVVNDIHDLTHQKPSSKTPQKVINSKTIPSLEPVKQALRKAGAKSLDERCISYYVCDDCKKPIIKPEDGFLIQGNIYVADTSCMGGIIGDNIPRSETNEKIKFTRDDIHFAIYCKKCLFSILDRKN